MTFADHQPVRRKQIATDLVRVAMNKLLSKKKAPEAITTSNESLHGPRSPQLAMPDMKKSSGSRWKKTKKQPEPQPDVGFDLSLPSTDDFRTSLLMPNLSARFSMLREQDDPRSLLGKASDDSVLAPRRRSRLGDFGFSSTGLKDIAEIQSINGSIRPPFATQDRHFSGSDDGYGSENDSTTNGSVMSRARRGEGNNLFGGRQKVYRIPTSGANSTKSGKAVYEDDVGKSAFQRYKQKERDDRGNRPSEESSGFDFGLDHGDLYDHDDMNAHTPNDSAKDLSHSPSFSAYDKKRSTTSSMARSEARSSTAATSITSQPAVASSSPLPTPSQIAPAASMPSLKSRRLYEQGLDQHMQEQQTSAITRLHSIQRQRTITPAKQSPPTLTSPQKSGRNLNERAQYAYYPHSGTHSGTHSRPQSPITGSFGVVRQPSLSGINAKSSGVTSPSSPITMDFDENSALTNALEPGDRGKATALGAFNKPRHQFDERQYLERQHQLLRSQSKAGSHNEPIAPTTYHQRSEHLYQPERERGNSDASTRSRSNSLPKKYELSKAYNLFQTTANQMPGAQGPDRPIHNGNLEQNTDESEDERNDSHLSHGHGPGPTGARGWQPNTLPSVSEHPALRSQNSKVTLAERRQETMPGYVKSTAAESSMPSRTAAPRFTPFTEPVDSPTLGSTNGQLNGMMQHLRSKSDVSSIYPNDNDPLDDDNGLSASPGVHNHPRRDTIDFDPAIDSAYTSSNPWGLNDLDSPYTTGNAIRPSVSPIDDRRAPANNSTSRDSHDVSPESEVAAMPWHSAPRKQHARDASSATQLERDAFADELAVRRNAIQENMKSIAERETQSRGASPARSTNNAFKTFGIPKSKSRESINAKRDPAHDPMPPLRSRMFGGDTSANGSNVDLHYDNSGSSVDHRSRDNSATRPSLNRPRNNSGARAPAPTLQTRSLQSSEWERSRARAGSESSYTEHRQMASRRSPVTSMGPRSRSNSSTTGTGGRSRSRTGPYRDDLQRAMMEGTGTSAAGLPDMSPMLTHEATPRVSPDGSQIYSHGQDQEMRPGMNNYFDAKASLENQHTDSRVTTAGLGQATLANTVYSPPLSGSGRPTPVTSPFAQSTTSPPLTSNISMSPFSSSSAPPHLQKGTLRKKTISKSDISEPTLISSTSNVDTVDLPPGASLKNGIDEVPPIPPMSQKRRTKAKIFSRNRSGSGEVVQQQTRTKSPDQWPAPSMPSQGPRGTRSNSNLDSTPRYDMFTKVNNDNHASPSFQEYGYGPTSPERITRPHVEHSSGPVDGGMF